MRKSVLRVACTLDGFIARKDGGFDWIRSSEEATATMKAFWTSIDTIVVGRGTYELARKIGKPWPALPGVCNYVCSRTMRESPEKHVQLISEDAAAFVGRLKNEKGKDIFVMGGGKLAKSLFEAQLIDEIQLTIQPLLLGSGIPLFLPMSRQIDWELTESKTFKNGCIWVTYRLKR